MNGHFQDVLQSTRQNLAQQIDLKTSEFSTNQRALINSLVGASMADLTWRSDTNPNAEKKWEIPKIGIEVASTVVDAAARFVGRRDYTDQEVREFSASPNLRRIAAETKIEVLAHLERRARGH